LANILVTGAAGFVGFHTAKRLLEMGHSVVGVDNLNDYYSVKLKDDRLNELRKFEGFEFKFGELSNQVTVLDLFNGPAFDRVIHLAAQAGVRYSLDHPDLYIQSNIVAFSLLLEACRQTKTEHLIFASSSSVYGSNTAMPYSESDHVDHPISLYAATKKSNELMAHSYSHLFQLPVTGLRFFTVYGPWGRPDMAPMLFAKAILKGEPIKVFNNGKMKRDFTYVADIVEGVVKAMDHIPKPNPGWDRDNPDAATSSAPYQIFNIGNHEPVELLRFIEILELCFGKKAEKILLPLQPGDVVETYADTARLRHAVDFSPSTRLEDGLLHFVNWYRDYYRV